MARGVYNCYTEQGHERISVSIFTEFLPRDLKEFNFVYALEYFPLPRGDELF
jgi:hypothetical protein